MLIFSLYLLNLDSVLKEGKKTQFLNLYSEEKQKALPNILKTFYVISDQLQKDLRHEQSEEFVCWSCVVCAVGHVFPVDRGPAPFATSVASICSMTGA